MQFAMMAVLTVALLVAVVAGSVMGIRLNWRARVLSNHAAKRSMRFSREDPFEIPLKYREFSLFSCGHSPCALNVIYGKTDSRNVCAFDFRYEVGHGTRRVSRHYRVIVSEVDSSMPELMMWNDADAGAVPLSMRRMDGHIGNWSYTGMREMALFAKDVVGDLADSGLSLQVLEGRLLLCIPEPGRRGPDYAAWVEAGLEVVGQFCNASFSRTMEETSGGGDNHLEKAFHT